MAVTELKPTRWEAFRYAIKRAAAGAWRPVREGARKLVPSRGARWTFLYVPAFYGVLLFVLQAFGLTDLRDYLLEIGARSAPLLVATALAMLVTAVLGWNLDNQYREQLQRILHDDEIAIARRVFAFAILAGEFLAIFAMLWTYIAVLLVLQG